MKVKVQKPLLAEKPGHATHVAVKMIFSEGVKKDRSFFAWVPAILWGLNVLVFSVLPYKVVPPLTVGYFDKICHFFAYYVLAFLLVWGIKRSRGSLSLKNIAFALILAIGYGILIELFQSFVPGREACIYDVLFNTGGVITGMYFGKVVLWRR